MKEDNINVRIIEIINKIKPFIMNDGGNLEFIKYNNGIVYVKLSGACSECPMIDITLKDSIEQLLINEIPEIKEVKNIVE